MAQGKIYSTEIIRLCEHHRMHAVQIEGQWRIDASILSPVSSDFKTMPLGFFKGDHQQREGKKIVIRETATLS
jgi:hypothetical protein